MRWRVVGTGLLLVMVVVVPGRVAGAADPGAWPAGEEWAAPDDRGPDGVSITTRLSEARRAGGGGPAPARSDGGSGGDGPRPGPSVQGFLARTGSEIGPLLLVGVACFLVGALLVLTSRLHQSKNGSHS